MLLILAAIVFDLRTAATEPYPVAARRIPAGTAITADSVSWVDLPRDQLPVPDLAEASAVRNIEAGEPLTSALIAGTATAPPDWWTVPIEIGELSTPGDDVMLVIADPPLTAFGVVIEAQVGDPFNLDYRPAAVAVPPDAAPLIAAAEREGLLITAVRGSAEGR